MRVRLPPRRAALLEAVRSLQKEKGARPTYSEIAKRCGISKVTARDHVRELRLRGVIQDVKIRTRDLSEVEKKALMFICESKLRLGRTPGLKEISEAISIKNLSLVRKVLIALEMKGYIKKPYRKRLSIQVRDIPDSMVGELSKMVRRK